MPTIERVFWPDPAYTAHDQSYGTDIDKLLDAEPGSTSASTTVDFGSSGNKTITFDPNTGGRTTTGAADDLGWAINNGGADGMGSTSTAKRRIEAGNWTIGIRATASSTPLSVVTGWAWVYRVAASPSFTRTLLGSGSTAFNAGVPAVAAGNVNITISLSEIVLEAGETIQVSYGINATGQIGGYVVQLTVGNTSTRATVPSPGIRTQYLRSLADDGPSPTDGLTRIVTFPRALADDGPAPTDDITRALTMARALADSGPSPTDDLTRVVTFPRALDDSGPTITDGLDRVAIFNRAIADSGPSPTDEFARSLVMARSLADAGPQITDDLSHAIIYNRALEDDITTGTPVSSTKLFGLFD